MPKNPYLRRARKYATRHLPKGTSALPGAQMNTSSTPPPPGAGDGGGTPPCYDTDSDGDDGNGTGGPTSGSGQ